MSEPGTVTDPEEIRRILEERAAALAVSSEDAEIGDTLTVIVMVVGEERYGVNIDAVREIRSVGEITPMPATARHWLGLVNLRGQLYGVLDLAAFLGLPSRVDVLDPQLVLVERQATAVGLYVDAVSGIRTIPVSEIGPSLADAASERAGLHLGLTNDLLTVLDVDALLTERALVVHDDAD